MQRVSVARFRQHARLNVCLCEEFHRIAKGVNDGISFFDFAPEPLCFISRGLIDFGKDYFRNDANTKFPVEQSK